MQGARVWVREKEQLLPATVNSCGDGTLVITTDYGEVRKSVFPQRGNVKSVDIRFLPHESRVIRPVN